MIVRAKYRRAERPKTQNVFVKSSHTRLQCRVVDLTRKRISGADLRMDQGADRHACDWKSVYSVRHTKPSLASGLQMPIPAVASLPAVILLGTAGEVDRFIVAALWTGKSPVPTVAEVTAWAHALHQRGDAFASHSSACHYWLYEQRTRERLAASSINRPLSSDT